MTTLTVATGDWVWLADPEDPDGPGDHTAGGIVVASVENVDEVTGEIVELLMTVTTVNSRTVRWRMYGGAQIKRVTPADHRSLREVIRALAAEMGASRAKRICDVDERTVDAQRRLVRVALERHA